MMLLPAPVRPKLLRSQAAATWSTPPAYAPDVAPTSGCPNVAELGFHVGRIGVASTGALKITTNNAGNIEVQNPSALARADVCAEPKTPTAAASLPDWTLGLSRTLYEDYAVVDYEKSWMFDRLTKVAGGPVLDVAPIGRSAHTLPFDKAYGARNEVSAARLDHTPLRLQTVDSPMLEIPPEGQATCAPPDSVQRINRMMDFTAFLLARNEVSGDICTLAHVSYRQVVKLHFVPAERELGEGEPKVGGRAARQILDGKVEVEVSGLGAGTRTPELGAKQGMLANDFARWKVLEDDTCR